MTEYAADIAYAYAQLGLTQGASREDVGDVLKYALAYPFFTRPRIARVRKLVGFLEMRELFGPAEASFADIRKAYHRQAMALHPDRNRQDPDAEERLKEINAAFAVIEEINREAKEYYKQNEAIRRKAEWRARDATARENPQRVPQPEKPQAETAEPPPQPKTYPRVKGRKYLAASVPRNVRTSRLSYLPRDVIIGSHFVQKNRDINYIFDVIMLPEDQFLRAKSYLAMPEAINPALQYGKFSPPYILKDTREIVVPEDEADPQKFAYTYFKQAFGIS